MIGIAPPESPAIRRVFAVPQRLRRLLFKEVTMRDFLSKVRCSAATVAYGVLAAALWDALKFFIEQLT